MNERIAPSMIKVGQKVRREYTVGETLHAVTLVVKEVDSDGARDTNGSWWSIGISNSSWFLVEDAPDPEDELIGRIKEAILRGADWAYEDPHTAPEDVLAAIRETHNITPKEDE